MKVLCVHAPCGPHYVRTGWGRVFQACGHDFRFWSPQAKSAFDAFTEFEPDLFIGTTYDLDKALFKCIAMRPQMKVILFASAWGDLVKGLDREKYSLVVVNEQEKGRIEELKAATGRPDFVFVHVSDRFLEGTMGGWRTIGVRPVGILNAADTFEYLDGQYRHELRCDVGFVGGYWSYKARNLDSFILPMCHLDQELNVKLFGNSRWPVAQYLGSIEDADVRDLFASARVCPNVSEPHSTDLGFDVIERPFKVFCSGGLCVSDYVEEASHIFGDCLLMARTGQEMLKLVRAFLHEDKERKERIAKGRRLVLQSHTYWERVASMFEHLDMKREATRVSEVKTAHLKGKL